jgi:hypothetical protein
LASSNSSVWLTAKQASEYAGGINEKYIRELWARGLMRYSKPDLGQMVTKREWIDEYLESREVKGGVVLDNKIDNILKDVFNA